MNKRKCQEQPNYNNQKRTKFSPSSKVASFYNILKGRNSIRRLSPVYSLLLFHNWIKATLIQEYVQKSKEEIKIDSFSVLDLGCGSGGDLQKWNKAGITNLICVDISNISLMKCEKQYFRTECNFNLELIESDFTKDEIVGKCKDPQIKFQLVSCQFAMHYAFGSPESVDNFIANVSKNLVSGGFFIATTPDEATLKKYIQEDKLKTNDLCDIRPKFCVTQIPAVGAEYHFFLRNHVDCPEYLVTMNILLEMAEKHSLELIKKESFSSIFHRYKTEGNLELFKRMMKIDYSLPTNVINLEKVTASDNLGVLSKKEKEITDLYTALIFKKK